MISSHDFSICVCTICGLIMVVGCIWLLKTGAIKLAEANGPGGNGVTVEFVNWMKITTQYPAVGLFIIGLAFVIVAIRSSQEVESITLTGKITINDPSQLKVTVQPDIPMPPLQPDTDGNLQVSFRPELHAFWVNVNAPPGYLPASHSERVSLDGKLTYPLHNQMVFTPVDARQPVVGLPANVSLAPFVPPSPSPSPSPSPAPSPIP